MLISYGLVKSPLRLTVRTPDFQSDNKSSTLLGGTNFAPLVLAAFLLSTMFTSCGGYRPKLGYRPELLSLTLNLALFFDTLRA